MSRYLSAGGVLSAPMGVAMIPPVAVARTESGWQGTLCVGILVRGLRVDRLRGGGVRPGAAAAASTGDGGMPDTPSDTAYGTPR